MKDMNLILQYLKRREDLIANYQTLSNKVFERLYRKMSDYVEDGVELGVEPPDAHLVEVEAAVEDVPRRARRRPVADA